VLVAILDRDDAWHERCLAVFERARLPLLTSTAVLTELFHLVGDCAPQVDAAWKLVRSGALTLARLTEEDLPSLQRLMERYRDRPMDFADATLVHLAERESLTTVFTVDNSDFETYRIGGRRRFRILPGR
jgi:predicted nucleic acid-binding protein